MTAELLTLFEPDSQLVHPEHAPEATLEERFLAFHAANGWVYRALEHLVIDMLRRGRTRIGIAALFEVLRWEWAKSTTGSDFKLNNSHRAFYARALMAAHPEWGPVFETRRQKTGDT